MVKPWLLCFVPRSGVTSWRPMHEPTPFTLWPCIDIAYAYLLSLSGTFRDRSPGPNGHQSNLILLSSKFLHRLACSSIQSCHRSQLQCRQVTARTASAGEYSPCFLAHVFSYASISFSSIKSHLRAVNLRIFLPGVLASFLSWRRRPLNVSCRVVPG